MLRGFATPLVFICLLSAGPAGATILRAGSIAELSDYAPLIVRGAISQTQPYWGQGRNGGKYIRTATVLDVTTILKGNLNSKQIRVCAEGGRIGDAWTEVSGEPSFEEGEEVLLFLQKDREESWTVVGCAQGKYSIVGIPGNKGKRAKRSLDGLTLVGNEKALEAVHDQNEISVDELLQEIRNACEKGEGR